MKIAIPITGSGDDAMLEGRFGRAARFLLLDGPDAKQDFLDNTVNLYAAQGAGIQTAQNLAAAGVEVVISANTGPKAFSVLKSAGIRVHQSQVGRVADILRDYFDNKLPLMEEANAESHW